MSNVMDLLGKKMIFFDGAMGTQLQKMGLAPGELPESWNIKRPEDIIRVHMDYLKAGSNIIGTNTFGANRLKFKDDLEEIVTAGVNNVKEAIRRSGKDDVFCALDMGSLGKLLAPLGDLEYEDAIDLYADTIRIGVKAGADLILIETMNDTYEAKAAIIAAKENSNLPIFVTCVFDESGKMLTGGTVESVVSLLEGLKVDAFGINCSLGPRQVLPFVKEMLELSSTPIVVNPNAGMPKVENGQTVYTLGPGEFSDIMVEIADLGVYGLGGCCGTNPEYIRLTVEKTKDTPLKPIEPKHHTVISSYSKAVYFGKHPVIIGERINPTGKPTLQKALREEDYDYILSMALSQEDAGAHVLDVNVGLPEIDEPRLIKEAIKKIQAVTTLPLQPDTSDPLAMEAALRVYNGKAIINSVNGKQEVMDAVFPLVVKYGGVVVALPLDEDGIPNNPEGRVKIAKKIYKEAEKYGIPKKDIIVDALALTISADSTSALTSLGTIKKIAEEEKGLTSIGVANISFGLPRREIINATFLSMAFMLGMNCAIMNPSTQGLMDAYRGYMALMGLDEGFKGYIEAYSGKEPAKETSGNNDGMGLFEAITKGMAKQAEAATQKELQTRGPLEIINEDLITALNKAGEDFEKGTTFLPQLLMSAEAASKAFECVKKAMKGETKAIRGKVILATVKGDIHDIGKNIVKVLLENYGYEVLDLGKDVEPERILAAAIEHDIKVVGLSALMTTTVVSMEDTIKLFRKKRPDTKIVVGGAVLTESYAKQIGADCYSKDAMSTIRYCDKIFE